MFEVRSSSRLRGGILCFVLLLCCFARGEKCAKEGGGRRKCGGRHYKLTSLTARAADLPVGTLVCRVHWDEIRRKTKDARLLEHLTRDASKSDLFPADFSQF